jgi:hypothetical protein
MGVRLLRGLFYETTLANKSTVVYTLKDEDHEGYPSLRRLYFSVDDPTEYEFAVTFLDGVDHWEQLQNASWFKPYLTMWRKEKELKFKSGLLAKVIKDSRSQTTSSMASTRYLLEKGWDRPKENNTKGRPTKADIAKAAHEQFTAMTQIEDDFERIKGLN